MKDLEFRVRDWFFVCHPSRLHYAGEKSAHLQLAQFRHAQVGPSAPAVAPEDQGVDGITPKTKPMLLQRRGFAFRVCRVYKTEESSRQPTRI